MGRERKREIKTRLVSAGICRVPTSSTIANEWPDTGIRHRRIRYSDCFDRGHRHFSLDTIGYIGKEGDIVYEKTNTVFSHWREDRISSRPFREPFGFLSKNRRQTKHHQGKIPCPADNQAGNPAHRRLHRAGGNQRSGDRSRGPAYHSRYLC